MNQDRNIPWHAAFREKKALLAQIEGLTAALDGCDGESTAAASKVASQHATEVAGLRAAIQQLQAAQLAERQDAAADKLRCLEEVDGWCTGEIDAVRHQAKQQVEKATAEAQLWQQRAEEQGRLLAVAQAAADEAEALVQQVREKEQVEEAGRRRRATDLQQRFETASSQLELERRQSQAQAQQDADEHHSEVRKL